MGAVRFASRRYRHLLIIIALYGRDMFMSRRLIIFGNYLPHKSEVYERDRRFPHSIPRRERVGKYLRLLTRGHSRFMFLDTFSAWSSHLYSAEIREDVKILPRVS